MAEKNLKSAPPFLHTPYDGSSRPFTVGLKPIEEYQWLEPDPYLVRHLAQKEDLLSQKEHVVFQAEPETDAAQQEILKLVCDHLAAHHCATHQVSSDLVKIVEDGRIIDLPDRPALRTAARLVQEDLVLMRPGKDGYRLAAACLCFPSSWSLIEKFSQSMTDIHVSVPGFNGERMGMMVARIFDNLNVGQILERYNWSIYGDGELHHPEPRQLEVDKSIDALGKLFLRVERQTLRRLPGSGDILFTIKIHHDPMAALKTRPDRQELATRLRNQLLDLDHAQLKYKGLAQSSGLLTDALQVLAETPLR